MYFLTGIFNALISGHNPASCRLEYEFEDEGRPGLRCSGDGDMGEGLFSFRQSYPSTIRVVSKIIVYRVFGKEKRASKTATSIGLACSNLRPNVPAVGESS